MKKTTKKEPEFSLAGSFTIAQDRELRERVLNRAIDMAVAGLPRMFPRDNVYTVAERMFNYVKKGTVVKMPKSKTTKLKVN